MSFLLEWAANDGITRDVVHNNKHLTNCSMAAILKQEGYI